MMICDGSAPGSVWKRIAHPAVAFVAVNVALRGDRVGEDKESRVRRRAPP